MVRSPIHRLLAPVFAIVGILSSMPAWATAPAPQRTNPTQGTNLFSVVEMMATTAPTGIGSYVGTGTIIDKWFEIDYYDDVQPAYGYFCIITADHNFPSSRAIAFGDAPGIGAPDNRPKYDIVRVHRGGWNGRKDLALAVVRYGLIEGANNLWNSVDPIALWSAPIGTDDYAIGVALEHLGTADFTEIGFGNTGTRFPAAGAQTGWSPQDSAGIQRFQNETIDGFTVDAIHGAYTYTDVKWTTQFPALGSGEGSSFPGDSGGPYLVSSFEQRNINGLLDINGNALPAQNISLATDTLFAVHTFGNNANPQLFGGANHGGVLITDKDINWINNYCRVVPETHAYVMVMIALAFVLISRWRASAAR
jgi:hypothetical protein